MTHAQKLKRIQALIDSPDVIELHKLIIHAENRPKRTVIF
jgi:hypothetical protein